MNQLNTYRVKPRAFIRVSESLRYLVISRSDFIYPHKSEHDAGPRDETRYELLDGDDGDIILSFVGKFKDAEDAAAMLASADALSSTATLALSDQDAGLLEQGASMLEALAGDERNRGNDSAAMGAGCSAHAVRRLAAGLLTLKRVALDAEGGAA